MENEREGPLPCFFSQNRCHIIVCVASVNHEGQLGDAGSFNVASEHLFLRLRCRIIVVIIEPRFSNRHAFGIGRGLQNVLQRYIRLILRIVWVGANRTPDIVIGFGHCLDLLEFADTCANSHDLAHARVSGANNQVIALVGEIRKIKMAMRVNEHNEDQLSTGAT